LNASVWTSDTARGRRLAARLRAGSVNVNEGYAATWGALSAPMGGMRDSGIGRRHGAEGSWKHTEPQTIATQRGRMLDAPPGIPSAIWARGLVSSVRAPRVVRRR
jgi:succinate-semialdehyde dehydrogenase/glutarate-semialdehyde dehydrogenase